LAPCNRLTFPGRRVRFPPFVGERKVMVATRNEPNATDMTPERWQRVKGLLATVLETDRSERPAYLDKVCAGDAWLRAELENLLAAGEEADAGLPTLGATTGPAPEPGSVAPANVRIGRRLGPYQIVEEIGLGGMGEVYRAFRADDQYKKEVAIKLMRSGQDSKFVVARFRNERQVLASLDHPNIARLLDGGTTDEGMPYFVMELIAGQPITEYCDGQQLSTGERLKLFLQVCSAVQYAHQRLIIHRDLKPSNILVTCDGQPKLLDFGIAKILDPAAMTEGSEPTLTLFRLLTPAYASPEQVRGEAITTVSDVYSLGVLLYELLTGQRPYRVAGRSPQEIERAVCEWEPPRPSSVLRQRPTPEGAGGRGEIPSVAVRAVGEGSAERLSKRLRGDLDNIVLQALRKEPQRRYPSVEQLATDIRRHLENLPVSASKDTLRYRTAKFVRRHKAGVVASCAVALTVLVALGVTLREAHIARVERARAEQRFSDMRELARSNLFEFNDAIQNLPGSAPARHLVIQRSLGYLDKLNRDSAGDRGLMHELAAGYEKIAQLQGNFSGPGIGDSKAALASYQKAWVLRQSLAAESNNDVNELKAETALLTGYTMCLMKSGKTADAVRIAQEGLGIAELEVQKQPQDQEVLLDEARAHLHMAWVQGGNGSSASTREIPEAIAHDREALKLLMRAAQEKRDLVVLRGVFQANLGLAFHLTKNREYDEAVRSYDALASMINGVQNLPNQARFSLYNYRALLFDHTGDFKRAYEDERANLELIQSMVQADPRDLVAQINLAITQGSLGMEEARLGNLIGGRKKLDEAIETGEQLLAANSIESFYKQLLLIGYGYQAEILSALGDEKGAQAKYTKALATATETARSDPADLESRLSIAKIHVALGVVQARARQYPEASQEFRAALSQLDDFLRTRARDAEARYVFNMTRDDLAALHSCSAGRPCSGIRDIRLPNLNN